jgi:hypothetical protein
MEQIINANGSQYGMTVNSDGSINANVYLSGTSLDKFSSVNYYSGLMPANGSYVGTYEEVLNYSSINVMIKPQSTGSLYIDYSSDGNDAIRTSYIYSVSGIGNYSSLAPRTRYYRLRYVNDGSENRLYISAILSEENRGATYLPLISPLTDNYTTLSTKAVLAGKTPAGSYVNIDATAGGNLKVSVEDWNGVVGSVYSLSATPTLISQNPLVQLIYISSGTSTGINSGSAIGSVLKYIGNTVYTKVLIYSNNNLTRVGSWV